jgi:phosphoribosylanthranilate isomerase
MIVQIYTAQTPEEGVQLAPSACGLPGEISFETARDIVKAVGTLAKTSALSVDSDIENIIEMVQVVQPDILHLCGDLKEVTPEKVSILRERLPGMTIMQAIPVEDESAIQIMKDYEAVSDIFILDSFSSDIGGIGAAGFVHDWNISRKIVESTSVPVILAGGLSADNVEDAIRQVKPWGVDSLTKTNKMTGEKTFVKDIDHVKRFTERAKRAA